MTAFASIAVPARAGDPDAPAAIPDPQGFDAGWQSVRDNPAIQFDLPSAAAQERAPTPEWLLSLYRGIGDFFIWSADFWQVMFWVVLGLLALSLVLAIFPVTRHWLIETVRRLRRKRETVAAEPEWAPEAATARRLLEEADLLAKAGRYDEAVHLILFRSIEDIQNWRGDIIRPSLTSRDIARAEAIPEHARSVFARIVLLVERGIFACRPLGADDWSAARDDYARFALKQA